MTAVKAPSPPYVGPAKWQGSATNRPIRVITIHCTAGSCADVIGAAKGTTDYAKRTTRPSSFHYVRDERSCFQLVWDSVVAYHAPPNTHSIGYELCCSLDDGGKGHFDRPSHRKMLEDAAEDVARLCIVNGIPIRRLTIAQLRAGEKGLAGHADIRDAFGQTSHWDPGLYFPWGDFLRMVRAAAKRLTAAAGEPDPKPEPPTPTPTPTPELPTDVLRLGHLSLKYNLSDTKTRADLDRVFALDLASVSFTEVGRDDRWHLVDQSAAAAGYVLTGSTEADVAVAVRERFPLLGLHQQQVHPGTPGPAREGGHQARHIVGPRYGWRGNEVSHFAGHWVTGYARSEDRAANHVAMTRAMIHAVEGAAVGPALAFFAGDLNVDEARDVGADPLKPHALFGASGLVTVWDELGKTPATRGRGTIDVIGSYNGDRRVEAEEAKVVHEGIHSDHHLVVARYRVRVREGVTS